MKILVTALMLLCYGAGYAQFYPLRKIDERKIYSNILDENRPILISKPNGYDQSKEKYFVVYVLDGNLNMYFTTGIAELLYQAGYPRLLIVGIPSTYRTRDLTPSKTEEAPTGGGADNFMKFIENELMPYVNNNYRTHEYSVLIGHSYGGLFAAHVLEKNQDLFDAYIAITPTVVHDDFLISKRLNSKFNTINELAKTFFFSVGHEPGAEGDAVIELNEIFKKSAPANLNWKYKYYPGENHSTTPVIATIDGLRFVFKDLVPDEKLVEEIGFTKTLEYYENLEKRYAKKINIPQRVLMNYGYPLLDSENTEEAFKVFNYYKEAYPKNPVGYDGLAILYEKQRNLKMAIENLRIIMKIAPGYEDAESRLAKLEGQLKE
ncbi:alpha/beta hydrolase-fold protein [Aureisphaera sp.]